MRTTLRSFSLLLLLAASAAAGDETRPLVAPPIGPPPLEQQIAALQLRYRTVVAELRSRDLRGLPAERIARRERTLELLADYAERGIFTTSPRPWPQLAPQFIDEHGNRCALASVIDRSGMPEVVLRLAAECNDAWLNEVIVDPEVVRALDELGLTPDEACYIHGPGSAPPPPASNDNVAPLDNTGRNVVTLDPTPAPTGSTTTTPPPATTPPQRPTTPPERRTARTPTDPAPPLAGGIPGGPTTPPVRGGVTGAVRRAQETSQFDVATWWRANADRFLSVRDLYRGDLSTTPLASTESWRVRPEENAQLRLRLAEAAHDPQVAATALGMWARITDGSDSAELLERTLAFMADPNQRDREWAPVILAALGRPEAIGVLTELVTDSKAGRARFGATSAIPETVRARAAVALGRCGSAVPTLTKTLRDQPAAHVDLAAACVMGLGLAAKSPSEQFTAIGALMEALDDESLPPAVLAQVPGALVVADAKAALPRLFDVVQRFRGPRELRAACAHALGALAPELDAPLCDALLALARRDVDVESRQAALLALGELSLRSGSQLDPAVGTMLAAFQLDGVQGRLRHATDVPWHIVAAGLFARGGHSASAPVVEQLREIAVSGNHEARGAALLALGLARDRESLALYVSAASESAPQVALPAIYSLGLVDARAQREELLALCSDSQDERLGFAAGYVLGCLADPMIIAPMTRQFVATRSDVVRSALARALGEIGDRRALPALVEFAFDPAQSYVDRERAIASLGVAAQRSDSTWNESIRHAVFQGEVTPTLQFLGELF
ncbi:MAG: HEAT repeat domain-containing protein [Planctomycetes bacterium]|nr:HEAT repeat domain-containing protein [Planctomycetota bacterium]